MAKARQQYFGDDVAIKKEETTFNLDAELLQKINEGEENVIEIVKVNGTPLVPDAQKAVDVTVPLVEDALDSTSTNNALSANQGRILYQYILDLQSRGRFLSNWNANNGTPVTAPFGSPYSYNPGDYYIVGVVAPSGGTNRRPDSTTYSTGYQSSTQETEQLDVGDMYVFDGTDWLLLKDTSRQIAVDATLSTTSPNPVENRVITRELNRKQYILVEGANIHIDSSTNVISADNTTYPNLPAAEGGTDDSLVTTGEKYIWNSKQDGLQAGANIQIVGNVISATDTKYSNYPAAQGGTDVSLVTTGDKYRWNNKQDELIAGTNITIANNVISATDTTYTAGTGISIDNNNVISADDEAAVWGHITGTLGDQTDLQTALNAKQDKLIPGQNIQIDNNTNIISATDTTYSASDFDIKDLADTLNLRNTWNNKQDRLIPGTRISIQNNVISADISGVFVYKGNVNTVADLPSSGQNVGDTYFVEGADEMYAWDGTQRNRIGGTGVNLSDYFNKTTDTSDSIIQGINNLFVSQNEKNIWNNKQNRLTPGTNITIANNVISAKEYTGGTSISIAANGRIDNEDPFKPTNSGSVGQVLKKTGTNTYAWQNESGGGGGGGSYNAGDGISISNHVITNTKPFEPTPGGTAGQVLTKTANGYEWSSASAEQEVRVWNIPMGGLSQQDMQDIVMWCLNGEHSAILKYEIGAAKDCFVYGWRQTSDNVAHYYFLGTWVGRTLTRTENGDYTTMYHTAYHISYDGTEFSQEYLNYDIAGNYLTAAGLEPDNPSPFMAQYGWQPATKAYVDNRNWTGTLSQYNALIEKDPDVVYNITSLS